jgi:hypothetical protein
MGNEFVSSHTIWPSLPPSSTDGRLDVVAVSCH